MIDDRMLARGKISVSCDATEDEIDFNLNPIFITEALTEEAASFQTYKGGELNNHLDTVYADGIYDIIVLAGNDGVGSMDIAYLKINYTNEKGEESNVWIALPENANNELSLDNTTSTDKNSNSLPTSSEAVTMTRIYG